MITIITLEGVVEGGPQEYKRVKGGDTMANIKRTKLVLHVKTVGNALAALYDHSLSDVVRVNEVSLGH